MFREYLPLKEWSARECMTRQYALKLIASGRLQSIETVHGYQIPIEITRADITPLKRGAKCLPVCDKCGQPIKRGAR
jgi:hypothetical protein